MVFETPKSKRFAYENDIKEKWLQVASVELLKFQHFYSEGTDKSQNGTY